MTGDDLRAEIVNLADGPYVLVRLTEHAPDEAIKAAATDAWGREAECIGEWGRAEYMGDVPDDWRIGPCELVRWVPDPGGGEYSRWLHYANQPGPGAFWAVECWPVYCNHDDITHGPGASCPTCGRGLPADLIGARRGR